jgi:hypothetical protein
MRKKKVWRYYCDHCKKSGCSGGHMARHETGCTRNPNRACGMCKRVGDVEQQPTDVLVDALVNGGLEKLRAVAEACPACMLAAIIQTRVRLGEASFDGAWSEFDFKAECKSWWHDVNMKEEYAY